MASCSNGSSFKSSESSRTSSHGAMCLPTCVCTAPCAFVPDISRCRSAWNGQRVHSTWISSLGPPRSLASRLGVRRASCCTGEVRADSSSTSSVCLGSPSLHSRHRSRAGQTAPCSRPRASLLRPAPRASESRSQGAVFPRAFMAYRATSTTMACCPPRTSMSTAAAGGWGSRADGQPGGSRSKANFSARLIHERVNLSRTAICRISSSTADTSAVCGELSGPPDGRDERWMWPSDLSVSASTAPLNPMHPPSVREPITSHRYVRMRGRSAAPGW